MLSTSITALRSLWNLTGIPQLTTPQISNYLLPVPPEPEQRAIAEALSDVDGLLNALEALIAKKQAIKQATMQQLLTGKTRLPGFSGAWETKRLGDCSYQNGRSKQRRQKRRMGNIHFSFVRLLLSELTVIALMVKRFLFRVKVELEAYFTISMVVLTVINAFT